MKASEIQVGQTYEGLKGTRRKVIRIRLHHGSPDVEYEIGGTTYRAYCFLRTFARWSVREVEAER